MELGEGGGLGVGNTSMCHGSTYGTGRVDRVPLGANIRKAVDQMIMTLIEM